MVGPYKIRSDPASDWWTWVDEWNYAVFELEDSKFRSELNQPEVRNKSVENFK
jgi:hypothetical protein